MSSSADSANAHTAGGTDAAVGELSEQSKEFLVARVMALERQLKVRNADCAALLQERQELLPLKAKCESQREMILALQEKVNVVTAERDSALDAVAGRERAARDAEHQALKGALGAVSTGTPSPAPGDHSTYTGTGRGARVVKTSHAGTQIIYDSSDISSIGFQTGGALPYDFLGGMGAYRGGVPASGGTGVSTAPPPVPRGVVDDSDDAEVQRAIRRAQDEAQMELKSAEREAQEEARLRARLEALRQGTKKP